MINYDLIVNCSNFNLGLTLPEPYSNNDQFIRLSVYTVPMYKSSFRIQNQLSFFFWIDYVQKRKLVYTEVLTSFNL